jgi:hypothetical protein
MMRRGLRVGVGRRIGPGWVGVSAPIPNPPPLPSSRAGQRAVAVLFVAGTALGCLVLALLLF